MAIGKYLPPKYQLVAALHICLWMLAAPLITLFFYYQLKTLSPAGQYVQTLRNTKGYLPRTPDLSPKIRKFLKLDDTSKCDSNWTIAMPEEDPPVLFRLTHMRQSLRKFMSEISKIRGNVLGRDITWTNNLKVSSILDQSHTYFTHHLKKFPMIKTSGLRLPLESVELWAWPKYFPITIDGNMTNAAVPFEANLTESLSAHYLSHGHTQVGLGHMTALDQSRRRKSRHQLELETGQVGASGKAVLSMLHVMPGSIIHSEGFTFSADIMILPSGCHSSHTKPATESLSVSQSAFPEVFSVAQPGKKTFMDSPILGYYHTLVEELPRLSPF